MAGEKAATLKILGNNLDAKEKLAQIREEADRLRADNPELTVKINRAQAQAEMAILKESLKVEADKPIIQKVKAEFDKVDFAKLGAGALWGTGIAAAAGPGVAALGALSGGALGVTAALGPAVVGLGLFGAVAKSVFTKASTDLTNLTAAQQAYSKATSSKARATALKDEQAAMANLTGSQRQFAESLTTAKNEWTDFVNKASPGVTKTLAAGMSLIPSALKDVAPILGPVEKSLTGLFTGLGKALNSPGIKSGIKFLGPEAAAAITPLGETIGHLANIALKAVAAFSPLGDSILQVIDNLSAKADAGANNALNKFLTWTYDNGPQVVTMLKNLGTTVLNLGKSFVSMGRFDIGAFSGIASLLATISKNPIGAGVLVGLLTLIKVGQAVGPLVRLVTAFKELSGVINLTKIAAIGLDAVPIVLVITGIIAAIVILVTHWNTVRTVAVRVWHDITGAVSAAFNWVKGHWPLLLGIITGPIGAAAGYVVAHFRQISQFASAVVSDIGHFFGRAKGLILGAFANAGSWLLSAGKDIVMGAVHGIESGFGEITSTIGHLASLIPGAFKSLLGIASPSKVMTKLATAIPDGIVAGLSGSTSQINSAAAKLTSAVKTAFTGGLIGVGRYSSLTDYIYNDTNRLKTLAAQRTAIANQVKAADAYAGNVSTTAEAAASLSTIGQSLTSNGGAVTGNGILGGLSTGLASINKFSADITRLRKAGLNKNLLDQIIQMGPVDGDQYANALLTTGMGGIRQANTLEKSISQASSNLGASAANAMYDAGKNAGKGFLTGLAGQEKAISAQMSKIGASMVNTIKRDLGIHSPSRVMAELGGYIADGLTLGIDGSAHKAVAASKNMISKIANPSVSVGSLGSSGRSAPLTVEWVGGSGADQEFISWLKKNIRIRGGDPSVLGR